MRDRDSEVEIIQVLAPDDVALSPGPAQHPPHHRTGPAPTTPVRQRRWPTLAAFAGVAFVAAAAVGSGSDDTAEPADTPTTTARAQLAPDRSPASTDARFVLDVPALRAYSADIVSPPSSRTAYRLWSDPGSTRRWLSLQVGPGELGTEAYLAATRRVVDGVELVSFAAGSPASTVVTTAAFAIGNGWSAVLRSAGIGDSDLARAAQGLPRNDRGGPGEPRLVDEMGLTLVASTTDDERWLYGDVSSTMRALTVDGTLVTLRVADGPIDDRRTALPFFTNELAVGSGGSMGGTLTVAGESVVVWEHDGHVLSLTAGLTVEQLFALRSYVRRADDNEWRALLDGRSADFRRGDRATAASATTAVVTVGDGSMVEVPLRRLFADAPQLIGAVRVEVEGAISVTLGR